MVSMVDIIAQHASYFTWDEVDGDYGERVWYVGCDGCDWKRGLQDAPSTASARHVAHELRKAGYGMRARKLDLDGRVI